MELQWRSVFQKLEDPRSQRNQQHEFMTLIGIMLFGALSGITSYDGLAEFAEYREADLAPIIPMPFGPPSSDTLRRFFNELNTEAFAEFFREFVVTILEKITKVIAIQCAHFYNAVKPQNSYLKVELFKYSRNSRVVLSISEINALCVT